MESNAVESCKCIASGVLVSFKVIKDELSYGEGDSWYTVKYWEYVRILRRVAPHEKMWARWSRGVGGVQHYTNKDVA